MPGQNVKTQRQKPRQTMTSFILSFPDKTPAERVVTEGKSKGMRFSVAYVYATRSKARRKDGRRALVTETSPPRSGVRRAGVRSGIDHLPALLAIVLDLGLKGVRDLLLEIEARLTTAGRAV